MIPWTIVWAALVGLISVYLYQRKRLNYFKELGIPHIPGWPITGNMTEPFLRTKHLDSVVKEVYNLNKEAKYVGFFDFTKRVFAIRDPELIKSIAVKNFDSFVDHPTIVDETLDPFFGKNLIGLKGDRWREVRNLLSPAFTSSKMKLMFTLISECAEEFSRNIVKGIGGDGRLFNTKNIFARYTNDVIATCAFGITVDSMKDPNNKFYTLGKKATNFSGLVTLKFFLIRAFPTLMGRLGIKLMSTEVKDFFLSVVGNIVETRDAKGIVRPDMIQLMMDARGKTSDKLKMDTLDMTCQAFIFFFGGFDASSTFMCFVAHNVAAYPDIQEKLHHEIDEVMRVTNGKPTYESINSMPYLDAVVNETLRRHPQVPFLDRVCVKSFQLPPALPGLKPVTIQPGNNIWVLVSGIHSDPKYYENPEKFDPERFLKKEASTNQATYLGFGIGPRMCIGNRFALLQTKVIMFHLLSNCHFKLNKKTLHPLQLDPNSLTIRVKGEFWLEIQPRNGIKSY